MYIYVSVVIYSEVKQAIISFIELITMYKAHNIPAERL